MVLKKSHFKVSGMKCPGCETIMNNIVKGANGIHSFTVDHSTGRGEIEYDPGKVDIHRVCKTMKDEGYECSLVENSPVEKVNVRPAGHGEESLENKKLHIKGMTCKSCEHMIRNHVRKMDGVKHIDVNYSKGTAHVTYDAGTT